VRAAQKCGKAGLVDSFAGRESFDCIKGRPLVVHPPNSDHGFIRPTRLRLIVPQVTQRHLCTLPRVSACDGRTLHLFLALFFKLRQNTHDRGVINHDQSAVEAFHSHLDRLLIFLVHCKDDRVSPVLHRNSAELR
jgi:hypothetical protein